MHVYIYIYVCIHVYIERKREREREKERERQRVRERVCEREFANRIVLFGGAIGAVAVEDFVAATALQQNVLQTALLRKFICSLLVRRDIASHGPGNRLCYRPCCSNRPCNKLWQQGRSRLTETLKPAPWCVMSHAWMSRVTDMNGLCHAHNRDLPHVWMSHVTHANETSWMNLVTYINESCHTSYHINQWVMSNM